MELNKLLTAISVSGALALGGCFSSDGSGSGGTDNTDDSDDNSVQLSGVTTGVFVDSAVAGLQYSASPSGREGLTDEEGTFDYEEGDTVTFSIGAIEIGSVTVEENGVVTPLGVAGVDSPNQGDYVQNIAQLLQSLDDDGFAGTGIEITQDTLEKAKDLNGDEFDPESNDQDLFEAGLSENLKDLTASNREPRTEPVARDQATSHLQNTINSLNRVTSCSDEGARTLDDVDLANKAFVSILTTTDPQGETRIEFSGDGTFKELANDNPDRTTGSSDGEWAIENEDTLVLDRPDEEEPERLDVCISNNDGSLLLGFEDDDEGGDFSRVAPQGGLSEAEQVTGNYTLSLEGDQIGRLTITEDGDSLSATLRTSNETYEGQADIDEGKLNILGLEAAGGETFDNATAYWVDGAVNQSAVYVENPDQLDDARLGKIEALGPVTIAGDKTFAGRTLFTRMADESNMTDIITILWFDSPSLNEFQEFANDASNDGEQKATTRPGSWDYTNEALTLDFEDGENVTFEEINEGSRQVYGVEEDGVGEIAFLKPARVNTSGMIGEYDISIPTENTSERPLQLGRNGECLMENEIPCTWEIAEDQRRVDITYNDFPEVEVYAWKIAGREGEYAFLQSSDEPPVEPGVMIAR